MLILGFVCVCNCPQLFPLTVSSCGRNCSILVRPLPPTGLWSGRYRIFRALGIVSALTGSGLLSYRLFVSTPNYHGPETDMRGKTVIVTEATTRFSRDLLQGLAKRGAQIVLCSRDLDACDYTRDKLLRATRVSASRVDCRALNFGSCVSVRRFAAAVLSDYQKIDSIVVQSPSCVTSIIAGKRRPTIDGFEHQLGTNYFGLYLLTRLLWKRLSESGGRLIVVADTDAAAEAAAEASCLPNSSQIALPIDDLNYENADDYVPKKAYQRSQWFLTLFAERADSVKLLAALTGRSLSKVKQYSSGRRRRLLIALIHEAKAANHVILRLNNEMHGEWTELKDQRINLSIQLQHLGLQPPT
ncbi:unnamed protein product [Dicrocoelium dendriticum]|nr:unnamed protein product [Dicrocoelium dendriticum]